MPKKEAPNKAEMGTKKYKQMVEKQNEFYDKHMAGKRDRKTGEYYHPISFNDPKKPKYNIASGLSVGYVECAAEGCDEVLSLRRSTRGVICPKCKKFNSFSREFIESILKE